MVEPWFPAAGYKGPMYWPNTEQTRAYFNQRGNRMIVPDQFKREVEDRIKEVYQVPIPADLLIATALNHHYTVNISYYESAFYSSRAPALINITTHDGGKFIYHYDGRYAHLTDTTTPCGSALQPLNWLRIAAITTAGYKVKHGDFFTIDQLLNAYGANYLHPSIKSTEKYPAEVVFSDTHGRSFGFTQMSFSQIGLDGDGYLYRYRCSNKLHDELSPEVADKRTFFLDKWTVNVEPLATQMLLAAKHKGLKKVSTIVEIADMFAEDVAKASGIPLTFFENPEKGSRIQLGISVPPTLESLRHDLAEAKAETDYYSQMLMDIAKTRQDSDADALSPEQVLKAVTRDYTEPVDGSRWISQAMNLKPYKEALSEGGEIPAKAIDIIEAMYEPNPQVVEKFSNPDVIQIPGALYTIGRNFSRVEVSECARINELTETELKIMDMVTVSLHRNFKPYLTFGKVYGTELIKLVNINRTRVELI